MDGWSAKREMNGEDRRVVGKEKMSTKRKRKRQRRKNDCDWHAMHFDARRRKRMIFTAKEKKENAMGGRSNAMQYKDDDDNIYSVQIQKSNLREVVSTRVGLEESRTPPRTDK